MRKVLIAFTFFLSSHIFGQTTTVPEPDFASRPYYLKDGKLENLEKTEGTIDTKAGVMVEEYLTAFKAKSDVRFSSGSLPQFYIKLDANVDPSDKVTVTIAQVKKDRRRFLVSKEASMLGGGKAKDISNTKVKVSFKKVRDGLYQIIFDAPLSPGEYAFTPSVDIGSIMGGGKLNLFCFGID